MIATPYGPGEVVRFNFAAGNGLYVRVRLPSGQMATFREWEICWA